MGFARVRLTAGPKYWYKPVHPGPSYTGTEVQSGSSGSVLQRGRSTIGDGGADLEIGGVYKGATDVNARGVDATTCPVGPATTDTLGEWTITKRSPKEAITSEAADGGSEEEQPRMIQAL